MTHERVTELMRGVVDIITLVPVVYQRSFTFEPSLDEHWDLCITVDEEMDELQHRHRLNIIALELEVETDMHPCDTGVLALWVKL